MKSVQLGIIGLVFCLLAIGGQAQQNKQWATPVESKHIENFYRVDDGVYRSGQPTAAAFREMEQLGIKEVLNLRNYHSDKDEAEGTNIKLHRVAMTAHSSEWDKLVEALRIIKNRKEPIVIHCWHGSDRTGLVVALYRLVFQGWTKEEALYELENGGFGYHKVYGNIKTFIRNMDVEAFKNDVLQ